jgi:hypothetical protein
MATHNKIGRLTERIETVVSRRRGKLTLESLTDEGWAKIDRCADGQACRSANRWGVSWSDDALLHFLIDDASWNPAISSGPAPNGASRMEKPN